MPVDNGGLGFDEMRNSYIFAVVGLIGVIVQGWLIRPLAKRFDPRMLMAVGISMSAIGLGWIPYITTETQAVGVFVIVLISTGHGLFGRPSQPC